MYADGTSSRPIERWHTTEVAARGGPARGNPYLEVRADVTFTGPDGTEIARPMFWDGADSWKARFAAPAPGNWQYRVQSEDDPQLDGSAGQVTVTDPEAGGAAPVYQHGFLSVAPSGRHLQHSDGTPFFWLGDTHWRFAYENWGRERNSADSWFRALADRRIEQGFTVYQVNLMLFDWGAETSPYFQRSGLFTHPNLDYFRDVIDPRIAYLAGRGLIVALGLGWHQAIDPDPAGMRRFAREIVARYGSYPVVWTLGGEVPGYEPGLRASRLAGWTAVAESIASLDDYHHPLTVHLGNERPIGRDLDDVPWLTMTLNQLGHGDQDMSPSHYRDYFERHPATPLVEGESFYEGLRSVEPNGRRLVTDSMVRHIAYQAVQSGCCGYTYGAQGCWNAAPQKGTMVTTWGDLGWREGSELPGGAQMGHLRRFYEGLPWTRLRPVEAFLTGSPVNDAYYPPHVAADPERDTVVVYFGESYRPADGRSRAVGLRAVPYTVSWFDPRTGVYLHIANRAPDAEGAIPVPDKPDDRDWLLLVRSIA